MTGVDAERDRRRAAEELEAIRGEVRKAPEAYLEGAPPWLRDVEGMEEFFSAAARVWDRLFGTDAETPLYEAVGEQIERTEAAIDVLVLGCGTGLELPQVFAKAPNARIRGIDLSAGMLAELEKKFQDRMHQIELVRHSYVGLPLGHEEYDYVIAVLTVHHVAPDAKLQLYRGIREALRPSAKYILADQSASQTLEQEILDLYSSYIAQLPGGSRAEWNFDITLSPQTKERLLRTAGFDDVRLVWEQRDEAGHGRAVFVAERR